MKNLKAGLLTLAFLSTPSVSKATPEPFTDEPAFTMPEIGTSKSLKKIDTKHVLSEENPINPPSNTMLAIMGGLLIASGVAARKNRLSR